MIRKDTAASLAKALLAFRQERTAALPSDIFGDHAWDMLLELFLANAEGRKMTGEQISERTVVSREVTSRWLRYLSKVGLIDGDGTVDLSDELTLSANGMNGVEVALDRAQMIGVAFMDAEDRKFFEKRFSKLD